MRGVALLAALISASASSDDSGALFVSKYLPENFVTAQNLSRVQIDGWGGKMHSGFFTINANLGKNTFFWFSEALSGQADAPLLLWLQGGPGASSLFGLFTEIGPFNIDANMKVAPRDITWNKATITIENYHLLFLDNPVGTGFSFTDHPAGFATNQTTVGLDLYGALTQFFELFPKLRENDLYITGESYAGKYVPACAYTIHKMNNERQGGPVMNLKGISIGDGAFDPAHQLAGNFGDLLYNTGMVDQTERAQFHTYQNQIQAHLAASDPVGAFHIFDEMLNGDIYPYPTYYANVTGMGSNYFNFEQGPDGSSLTKNFFIDWLATPGARAAIHVGATPYAVFNGTVEKYLLGDWMVGVVDFLVPLLENYKVLIYSGQNDIILGPNDAAKKSVWTTKTGDLAGYKKTVGQFTFAIVRGAGHMVPGDQPSRAYDLISSFVEGN